MGGFFSVEQGPFYNALPESSLMNNRNIKNANQVNVEKGEGNLYSRANNTNKNKNTSKINVIVARNNTARANRLPSEGPNLERGEGGLPTNAQNNRIEVVVNNNSRRNNSRNRKIRSNSVNSAAAPLSPSSNKNVEAALASNQTSDPGFSPNSPTSQAGGKRSSKRSVKRSSKSKGSRRNTRK